MPRARIRKTEVRPDLRDALRELVHRARFHTGELPGKLTPTDEAILAACTAIEEFLDDKHKSLEAALGLNPGRGRPRAESSSRNFDIAMDVMFRKARGLSWLDLQKRYNLDVSDLKAVADRHGPAVDAVISAEILKRLNSGDNFS